MLVKCEGISQSAHDVGEFAAQHDVERGVAGEGFIGPGDPAIGALGLAEDETQRLVDAHQV